jgi:ATP-dependent helicase HrpA
MRDEARALASGTSHPIERDGITDWDFGSLPAEITLQGRGHDVIAYPALIDDGRAVSIRLVSSRQEQTEFTWQGIRRLIALRLASPTRLLQSTLSNAGRLALTSSPYSGADEWMADCLSCALDEIMVTTGGLVWDESAFDRMLLAVRDSLADVLERVGRQSEAILRQLHDVESLLGGLEGELVEPAATDVADQIGQFIYPGFLTGVGADRLDDLRRYLEAAAYRLRKLPEDPQRDFELMARVRVLEEEHDELMDSLPWSPRMVEISWMLQELRVSFFAQPIGAKGVVSEKRTRRALADLLAPD